MRINKKGFTLLELLVVIAIIGLLSTLAVIALGSARQQARDAKRLTDVRDIQTALEYYFLEHNSYPVSEAAIRLGSGNTTCLNNEGFGASNCATPLMAAIPLDPGGAAYEYVSPDGQSYEIRATLEGEVNGLSGQVRATPGGIASLQ